MSFTSRQRRISETTCLKHKPQNTTASGLPSDNFILKIVSFAKDKPHRWGSNLLEVEKKDAYRHPLRSIWTFQQICRPTINKIQISKALFRQSFFLSFIKITALWGKKGLRRNPMSFSQEIQFFKLFLYCEKTLTYWHPSSATSFSQHTGQDAENSCITGNNLSTLQILNKCATVKMIYRPSSFPLGQAVATMDVTEKLEMLPSLPSHSGIFLLRSFVHLTELCLKCVFTPSLHDKPTQSEDRLIKTTDLQQGAQRWV